MIMARALLNAGAPFDCFERHSDVGGIWDPDNPGSPIYESAHSISSKWTSYFYGFPMPDAYPDYPSHRQHPERLAETLRRTDFRDLRGGKADADSPRQANYVNVATYQGGWRKSAGNSVGRISPTKASTG
jgi:hypothetical protein